MKRQLKDDKSKFGIKPARIKMNPLLNSIINNEPKWVSNSPYIDRIPNDLFFMMARSSGKTISLDLLNYVDFV